MGFDEAIDVDVGVFRAGGGEEPVVGGEEIGAEGGAGEGRED